MAVELKFWNNNRQIWKQVTMEKALGNLEGRVQ